GTVARARGAASMEPPRERGGNILNVRGPFDRAAAASMEPPRERGGNHLHALEPGQPMVASMEPPRERGGNIANNTVHDAKDELLQWSRRVNAAETSLGHVAAIQGMLMLQW